METHTETGLAKLKSIDISIAELQQLADDYKDLVVVEETYDDAVKACRVLREKRYEIQNIVKDNKGILNQIKSAQEEMGDERVRIIEPTEKRIRDGIKVIDDKKEEEKKRKEKEAAEKFNARIELLRKYEMQYSGESYTLGDHTISAVQVKVFPDAEFDEFLEGVKTEFQNILDLRVEAEKKKKDDEERLEKQRKEQEAEGRRLEALREEQEKKELAFKEEQELLTKQAQEKIDREKKEHEEKQAKLRKEEEEFLREKRDARIYQLKDIGLTRNTAGSGYVFEDVFVSDPEIDELNIKDWTEMIGTLKAKVADLKAVAEQKRIEAEEEQKRIEVLAEQQRKDREEAVRPDKEKLEVFCKVLSDIKYPELSDTKAKQIIKDAIQMVVGVQKYITTQTDNL